VTVYLDHNSTTPIRPEVRELYIELLDAQLGNASGSHAAGRRARAVVDDGRERIAAALGVPEEWVVFTSGGTEANNQALRGVLDNAGSGAAIATSTVEHSSVLQTALDLEQRGTKFLRVQVDQSGKIESDSLREALATPGLALLSIMTANNESGAVTPMAEVASIIDERGTERPLWHTDAVQALGKSPLAIADWGLDLVSLSAHKIGGPQGVGCLLRRPGIGIRPLLIGGGQESGARSGTENAAGIGACALAVQLAVEEEPTLSPRHLTFANELWHAVRLHVPDAKLVGPSLESPRLANTLNILFPGAEGHSLVARLDLEGLEASLGSACSSGALEASHVLLAMGYSDRQARAGLRLSMGRTTSHKDIHSAGDILGKTLQHVLPK
jgi:cysteine desulfurase